MAATYTYDFDTALDLSRVRMLIPDTEFIPNVSPPRMIFSDQEIDQMFAIQRATGFQSGMFFSGSQGRQLPNQPVSYYRVAAIALDILANNKGKLAGLIQLLDVKLQNVRDLVQSLRDGATQYRDQDDNSGAFIIAEQTNTDWSFRDRYIKQWMRQQGAGA